MRVQRPVGRACFAAAIMLLAVGGCSSDADLKSDAGDASQDKANNEAGSDVTTTVDGGDAGEVGTDAMDAAPTDVSDAAAMDHQVPEVGSDGSAPAPMNLTATVL